GRPRKNRRWARSTDGKTQVRFEVPPDKKRASSDRGASDLQPPNCAAKSHRWCVRHCRSACKPAASEREPGFWHGFASGDLHGCFLYGGPWFMKERICAAVSAELPLMSSASSGNLPFSIWASRARSRQYALSAATYSRLTRICFSLAWRRSKTPGCF